jgi:glyoxylate utilization-related uncharacterized protein
MAELELGVATTKPEEFERDPSVHYTCVGDFAIEASGELFQADGGDYRFVPDANAAPYAEVTA